jgi:hypothetical protein
MGGGKEIGEESGDKHFQGYIETRTKKTLWQMKRLLGAQTHIERAAASKEENVRDCMKQKEVVININSSGKKQKQEEEKETNTRK